MEPNNPTPPAPAPVEPAPGTEQAPVMDVKPPENQPLNPAPAPSESTSSQAVASPPEQKTAADKPPKPPKPPKAPRQAGSNVGLAVVATVVIVLGLGLLATYAYLQSH